MSVVLCPWGMGGIGEKLLNSGWGWDLRPPQDIGEGTRRSRYVQQKFNKNDREQGFLLPPSLGFGVSGGRVVCVL
jgi:hypothetical protein